METGFVNQPQEVSSGFYSLEIKIIVQNTEIEVTKSLDLVVNEGQREVIQRKRLDIRKKCEKSRVRHVRLLGDVKEEQHNRCFWC